MRRPAALPAVVILPLALLLLACGDSGPSPEASAPPAPTTAAPATASCQNLNRNSLDQQSSPPAMAIDVNRAYTARMTTSKGAFTIALNPKAAPVTANNFVCLGQAHFYDGLIFHRIVPGFVAQGGDPLGTGFGGPRYKLPNETNSTPWGSGSVAMASSSAGVSGSQFFIVLADGPNAQSLATSGVYNQFGKVTDGFDVVLKLQQGDTISSVVISEQ
jgi:cyclophilin family peptidyl-prolyl cis-trans isomerase